MRDFSFDLLMDTVRVWLTIASVRSSWKSRWFRSDGWYRAKKRGAPRREGLPVGVVEDKAHSSYEINRDRFSPIPKLTDCPEHVIFGQKDVVESTVLVQS